MVNFAPCVKYSSLYNTIEFTYIGPSLVPAEALSTPRWSDEMSNTLLSKPMTKPNALYRQVFLNGVVSDNIYHKIYLYICELI